MTEMLSRRRAADHRVTYWYYGDHGPRRGVITARPMAAQYGSGGGDQYGHGPGYSYARQAPNFYYRYYRPY